MSVRNGHAIREHFIVRQVRNGFQTIFNDYVTLASFLILLSLVIVGLSGQVLAPYGASERISSPEGGVLTSAPPSAAHPLGTTDRGYDVLSRLLIGTGPTLLAGGIGGLIVITIGTSIGMVAGYKGGMIDDVLMRITDIFYSTPLLPLAIVLVSMFGVGYFKSILIIGFILWRSAARVIRSQVLQIKERPFILALQANGVSTYQIMLRHLLPNVAPMTILYFSIGVGYTIILQASLAFLGLVNPFRPSWGIMLQNAYRSGQFSTMWWWSIPPGLLLSLAVMATLLFGRGYQMQAAQGERSTLAEAG